MPEVSFFEEWSTNLPSILPRRHIHMCIYSLFSHLFPLSYLHIIFLAFSLCYGSRKTKRMAHVSLIEQFMTIKQHQISSIFQFLPIPLCTILCHQAPATWSHFTSSFFSLNSSNIIFMFLSLHFHLLPFSLLLRVSDVTSVALYKMKVGAFC